LVYFQSFTNTYAPFETLKALYDKALSFDNVIGLSIGTRSDSITQQTLDYLSELAKEHEIWIEFGANVKQWILKSKEAGLNVCGHLIFGLPDEDEDMMLETAKMAYSWGVDSVKYHPLYVVAKTALANEYMRGDFVPITEQEYIKTLKKALLLKPDNVSVQRITAGIDDNSLIAPSWCKDKNRQIKAINQGLKEIGLKY